MKSAGQLLLSCSPSPFAAKDVLLLQSSLLLSMLLLTVTNVFGWDCKNSNWDNMKGYKNWSPNAILDVGANNGNWARGAHGHYPSAKILSLEASPKHDEELKQMVQDVGGPETAAYSIGVLYHTAGEEMTFYESDGEGTGDSLFKEVGYNVNTGKKRITSTVDEQVAKSFLKDEWIDYIKVDVQGAEGVVLQGMTKTLSQATFVQLEASIVYYNEGGACFGEIEYFMAQHGYYLYDMAEFNVMGNMNSVGQMDITFVRPTSGRLPEELKGKRFCMMQDTTNKKDIHSFMDGYKAPPPPPKCQQEPERVLSSSEPPLTSRFLPGFLTGVTLATLVSKLFQKQKSQLLLR